MESRKVCFFFSWREGDFNRARVDCECGKKRGRIGDFGVVLSDEFGENL